VLWDGTLSCKILFESSKPIKFLGLQCSSCAASITTACIVGRRFGAWGRKDNSILGTQPTAPALKAGGLYLVCTGLASKPALSCEMVVDRQLGSAAEAAAGLVRGKAAKNREER
jgi:hypothetical protein